MRNIIERIGCRKREQCSSLPPTRYSRLSCDEDTPGQHCEVRRGYVPVIVGKCSEEEERFMMPTAWMKHPSVVALLELSADEFGYHQEGVLHIPCEPDFFREIITRISVRTSQGNRSSLLMS